MNFKAQDKLRRRRRRNRLSEDKVRPRGKALEPNCLQTNFMILTKQNTEPDEEGDGWKTLIKNMKRHKMRNGTVYIHMCKILC